MTVLLISSVPILTSNVLCVGEANSLIDRDCRLPAPKADAVILSEGRTLICWDSICVANLIKVGTCDDGPTSERAIASGAETTDKGSTREDGNAKEAGLASLVGIVRSSHNAVENTEDPYE
jgi:hypothetical protein